MPSEVVNSVCSVLARSRFRPRALERRQAGDCCFLCEEAHRYMPADHRQGFAPTRARDVADRQGGPQIRLLPGSGYQRPGELGPTILSQCSTVFAMRLANEQDQAIIRSAIANSSASTLSFLSSMGQREAIAFGEGVATTMRLKFEKLAGHMLPGSAKKQAASDHGEVGDIDLASIVERLRDVPKLPRIPRPASRSAPSDRPAIPTTATEIVSRFGPDKAATWRRHWLQTPVRLNSSRSVDVRIPAGAIRVRAGAETTSLAAWRTGPLPEWPWTGLRRG